MKASERLLRYVTISSPANEEGTETPSSACQFDMANALKAEMDQMGFANVRLTDHCFVYAELPATPGMENLPVMGLSAHMDTAPAYNGFHVKPVVHPNYDGGDLELPSDGIVLTVKDFPHLPSLKGKTLITSDGSTLLGADDKAGIAEIMTACESVLVSRRPHGKLVVAFTPDEEIGMGVHSFDVKGFGADFAYTVDGGAIGEMSYENFNACAATVEITGKSVHPGSAKDTMINALLLAIEFNDKLPKLDTPRDTEGYQGFFHLEEMKGDVVSAKFSYILRDHDPILFDKRKDMLRQITQSMNQKWGEGTVRLTIRDQYRNMREKIEPVFFLIDNAGKAMKAVGIEPFTSPVRGGTDGAQLCYMGLPCPNLCTGGYAFHGPYEHICAEDMDQIAAMLEELICGPRA